MTKKYGIFIGVIVCLLAILIPAGCAAPAPAPGPGPAAAPEPEVFEWKFQTSESPGMVSFDKVYPEFVESVEKMSGGRLKLTLYPAEALCPLMEIHNAVSAGTIEMGMSTGAFWAGTVPAGVFALGLPFSVENMEEKQALDWERGVVDVLRKAYAEHNVYLLTPLTGVPYGSIMSSKPIRTLDDLKGMKIRSIGFFQNIWEAVGAEAAITDISEIYPSISTGVMDGANIGNAARFAAVKLYEVAKYYTMPPVSRYASGEFFVNMDEWNKLPDDLQEILTIAAKRAGTEFAIGFAYEDAAAMRMMVQDYGVEVNYFPDEDMAKLRAISVGVWDALAKMSPYNEEIVEITKDYMRYLGRLK